MANKLHLEAVCWLRFVRRFQYVCTEYGRWNCDVIGLTAETSVELEIKSSISDLKAEFKNKVTKHKIYNSNSPHARPFVPNYFYFFMPQALVEKAKPIIHEQSPFAGIISMADTNYRAGMNASVVHKAKLIHDDPPTKHMITTCASRMSSQICGLMQHLATTIEEINMHRDESLKLIETLSNRFMSDLGVLPSSQTESIKEFGRELAIAVLADDGSGYYDSPVKWDEIALKILSGTFVRKINGL